VLLCDNVPPLSFRVVFAEIGEATEVAANAAVEDGGVVDELGDDVEEDM
jgi:hypothetical protein